MATKARITIATRTKIITKSTFSGYDACINPYVGCEFGCSYCYVRFFVKDDKRPWGEFVRIREHLIDALPKELHKGQIKLEDGRIQVIDDNGVPQVDEKDRPVTRPKYKMLAIRDARLVIGTMTDPYQPQEKTHRITRAALEILLQSDVPHFNKVGIFTRSPLILQDLNLIKQLPRARVHFTITPFPPTIMRALEPYSPVIERRWDTIKKIKESGVRVHVNVSPVMPMLSEELIGEWNKRLADIGVDEYFVDPMQPYKESFEAFRAACLGLNGVNWEEIQAIMLDRDRYFEWKGNFFKLWDTERKKHEARVPHQLPIWSDHEHKVWIDMRTGQQMSKRVYGDDRSSSTKD